MATGALDEGSDCANMDTVAGAPNGPTLNTRWRNIMAVAGWTLNIKGSCNLPLMAAVIALVYGNADEKKKAIGGLVDVCDASEQRGMWHLKEQGSSTYSWLTMGSWILAAMLLDKMGQAALAARFRRMLDQWMALAKAMEFWAVIDGVPQWVVIWAGHRAWNHEGAMLNAYYQYARGERPPRPLPNGDWANPDNWGNNPKFVAELRASYERVKDDPWSHVIYGVWKPWTFAAYEDGTKASYLGSDEPEQTSEFQGISTPGKMLKIGVGKKVRSYPECPNPATGDSDMRNLFVGQADLDGDAERGWHLSHSTIGHPPINPKTGRYEQDIARPTAAKLVLWKRLLSDGLHDMMLTLPAVPASGTAVPVVGTSPAKTSRSWFERFLDWLGL
jgi:hypothetical protein